jgi:hypothetical protein
LKRNYFLFEKSQGAHERLLTHDSEELGRRDWDRALCGPGDGGMFGVLEGLCPLGSLLADSRA